MVKEKRKIRHTFLKWFDSDTNCVTDIKPESAYVVLYNTDTTEGKGRIIPKHVCKLKETATRLGKGKYVQGSNCPIEETLIFKIDGETYGPINLILPTEEDEEEYKKNLRKQNALKKAIEAGLSEEEIEALSWQKNI